MQAANLRVVQLDMWDIPELPRMPGLKHLVLSMGQRAGTESNSSDFVWTCLQHLTGLETLDLTVISHTNDKVRAQLLACMHNNSNGWQEGRILLWPLIFSLVVSHHMPACNTVRLLAKHTYPLKPYSSSLLMCCMTSGAQTGCSNI